MVYESYLNKQTLRKTMEAMAAKEIHFKILWKNPISYTSTKTILWTKHLGNINTF